MGDTEPGDINKGPSPELVTVKMEPIPIEPEFITIKEEPSWCDSPDIDAAIENEPTLAYQIVTVEMEHITKVESPATEQEPYNKAGFSSSNQHAEIAENNISNTKYSLDTSDFQQDSIQESKTENNIYKSYTHLKKYPCDLCKKRYRFINNLIKHRQKHANEKLICDICTKEFIKKSVLTRHIRVHTQEKPFRCKICSKKFSQHCNLLRHKQIHTGMKPHLCQICKKHFANASYLKLHLRTHTGEKPYSCDVCKKLFAVAGSLKRHKETHEPDRIIKPRKGRLKKR